MESTWRCRRATAELVSGNTVVYQWFPSRPGVLLLMVGAGVAFIWWTARCARLWIAVWRRRTLWPVIVLVLVVGGVALAAWLGWWEDQGTLFADGEPLDPNTLLGPGAEPAADRSILFVLMANASDLARQPLVLAAIAGLTAVPLLAWLVRPNAATPEWSRSFVRTGVDLVSLPALPPLHRVLVAGGLGGVVGWLAQAGLMAYLHAGRRSDGALVANYTLAVLFCVLAAWVLAAMAGAAIGAQAGSQHRLVVALIAAQLAVVVSFAGQFLLIGFDGCVPPLATLRDVCAWRPGPVLPAFSTFLGPALVVGFVFAFGVAAVVLGIRHAWQSAARPSVPPAGHRRGALVTRRIGVGVLCAVVIGMAVTAQVILAGESTPTASASSAAATPSGNGDPLVSTQTKATQMASWNERGGSDLVGRFLSTTQNLDTVLSRSPGGIAGATLRPFCADYDQLARDASAYFQVPDPQGQALWRTFVAQVGTAVTDCDRAAAESSIDQINTTLGDLDHAVTTSDLFEARLGALLRPGG